MTRSRPSARSSSRFLDEHLPTEAEAAAERSRSTSHVPEWARRWQRLQFDHGWLLPGNPPEFGGRNAGILEQFVHREELSRRRIYHAFNPQGVGIIAASLLSFGTDEQKQRWAVPILRAEITASLGMSEPGAGSDLAGLTTRAVLDGDHFVVNGQKVWTSGAHDADVMLAFVRTDPDAPKHKGISALLIPTDTPGVTCRPFACVYDRNDLDFNEVFLTDVRGARREPGRAAGRRLEGGQRIARPRTHDDVDGVRQPIGADCSKTIRPAGEVDRDRYAHHRHGLSGAAPAGVGRAGAGGARRGRRRRAVGAEGVRVGGRAERLPHTSWMLQGPDGLADPTMTAPYNPYSPGQFTAGWFTRYIGSFAGTIAGGTSEIQRNIIAQHVLKLPTR